MAMTRPTHFVSRVTPIRGALGQAPSGAVDGDYMAPAPLQIEIEDDAPEDSYTYGRRNGEWVRIVPLEGGTFATMTGPLYLHDDPVAPLQAATKRYTDELWKRIDSGTF
jgi:hypothetical protein